MAYIQSTRIPPNKQLSFGLQDFSGGLNNRSERIGDNQASDLMNASFRDDKALERRFGSKRVHDFITDRAITFVDTYRPYDEEDRRITATNNGVYVDNLFVQTVSGQISGMNYYGKYYFTDGVNLYVYGKFPQDPDMYTRITGDTNSAYAVMRVVSPPNDHPRLNTNHLQGITHYNYSTMRVSYEPCELEFRDHFQGANVVPQKAKFLTVYKGRLVVSGAKEDDDNVFLSDARSPYYFPVGLPIQLPPNSDKIKGLAIFDNSIIVGRKYDMYAISGLTNRVDVNAKHFELRKINAHTGFANHKAIQEAHNYLFYIGSDGNAYALLSAQADEHVLSTQILSQNIDLFRAPISLNRTDIDTACGVFHDDTWYVSIKDLVLVYSYRHRAWSLYNNLFPRSFHVEGHNLVWGDKYGQLMKFSDNYLDQGKPYQTHWVSKNFDMGQASTYKQFREFFVIAHTFDNFMSDVRITFEIDFVDVRDEIIIANQKSRWGVSKWGDRFITRNVNPSQPFVLGRRGRYIRFVFRVGHIIQDVINHPGDLDLIQSKVNGETLVYTGLTNEYYLYRNHEWIYMPVERLNQPMKVYEINGEYEMRGKR